MLFKILIVLFIVKIFTTWFRKSSYSKVCMVNKTVLIVGGSSGIGLEAAINLASRGSRLIIASNEDCAEAKNQIVEQTNIDPEKIIAKFVDFASFKSVKEFAKDILENETKIDVFISNVGVLASSKKITEDGFPFLLQVNYLSHFLLTFLLLDLLKKSSPSRIIYTSSIMAFASYNLEPNDLKNSFIKDTNVLKNILISPYSDSKLCLIILGRLLAKELEGTGIQVYTHYPGMIPTNLIRKACQDNFSISLFVFKFIATFFGCDKDNGSQVMITLATANNIEKYSGMFFWYHKPFIMPFKTWNIEYCGNIYNYTKKILEIPF